MKRIRRLNLLANSVAGKELLYNSDSYAEKEGIHNSDNEWQ